jgi:flagellar assembly protein FliH
MMSTSSSPSQQRSVVLRDLPVDAVAVADTARDLRDGEWTRFGSSSVLGDAATETTLRRLAERSRDAARAQGFAAGWAEGLRAAAERSSTASDERARAAQQRSETLLAAQRSALTALQQAAERCAATTSTLHAEVTTAAVELALQIAEAVLGRELQVATDPGADAVRRALVTVPLDVPVTVRLNPADLAVLDRGAAVEEDRAATLLPDASVGRGDAVVETADGIIDAGVAAALARVREVLR